MNVTSKRIVHGLESELGALAKAFPDVLLMCKMICQSLTNERYSTEGCRIYHSHMSQDLDQNLGRNLRNRAWRRRGILDQGLGLRNRKMSKGSDEFRGWYDLGFICSWLCCRGTADRSIGRWLRILLPCPGEMLVSVRLIDCCI